MVMYLIQLWVVLSIGVLIGFVLAGLFSTPRGYLDQPHNQSKNNARSRSLSTRSISGPVTFE